MLPLSLGWIQYIMIFIINMAEGGEEAEIVTIPDDPNDDWLSGGPQNLREAEAYAEKVNQIFEDLGELLCEDNKDVLLLTIHRLKKHMEHHWEQMKNADVDTVVRAIKDLACLHLRQHLTPGGMEVQEPATEVPTSWEFLRQLPEKKRKEEEHALIISTFNHLSEACAHISMPCANISSLGKIADRVTFDTVLKVTIWPLVQVNVLAQYLNPMEDPKVKTAAEITLQKIESMVLPREDAPGIVRSPRNGPTHILAAAVWLKM